ncbi:hypothetical protein K469DRAFT_565914 [Zopfia rhizophila CBS 207.26]|uniref:Uncharacterized protein n=1 Tax=Zopfia rhizophila CBS 207.26 TaxID=1314779 RepID=A0A6A6EBW2_9PEZI|nr:hypothetical protein K469DRAFT_565914 [Zopfia rhizophila CBS 207.26]
MTSQPQPKITLYRGWLDTGKYVWSPFVTKLEFRLRTSNIPYTTACGSTSSGPTGIIPYIELSSPSSPLPEFYGDSSLIMKTLIDREIMKDVNARLDGKEKAIDLALRALVEDKLYFFHTYERWIQNYYTMRDHVLWQIPYPLRIIIGLLAYRGTVRKLHDQGTGRFSNSEIRAFIKEIWEGINGILVESKRKSRDKECFWLLGRAEPTEADASVFGFVVSVLVCDAGPESRELVRGFPVVVEWVERIHKKWFPDYEVCEGIPRHR